MLFLNRKILSVGYDEHNGKGRNEKQGKINSSFSKHYQCLITAQKYKCRANVMDT